jgi:putative Mg2+ transporter-C (MgtC) family protein
VFPDDPSAQARIMQGLITGVGFLGGGAILKKSHSVSGTATAASIWATAGVGAAVAYDRFEIALVLAAATFAMLRWLKPLKGAVSGDPDS